MARLEISTKRLAISKTNAQLVVIISASAFVTIFCLVAAKAVWSQTRYQARVTSQSQKAHAQLQKNLTNFSSLSTSYNAFQSTGTNIIGGNPSGTGPNDGSNAKIILDALPSTYDFPALASSLEKVLSADGFPGASISGTDDQLAQQTNISSPNPQPVAMPFTISINNAAYNSIQQLVANLNASIRPIQIDTMSLSGSSSSMTLSLTAHSYYQPGKTVNITKQVVK